MNKLPDLSEIRGFEWDEGNIDKNWDKHQVKNGEAMEVFDNEPRFLFYDSRHSKNEKRFGVFGETNHSRGLVIIFTIRAKQIRIISARDQNKKERRVYEKFKKNTRV